MERLIEPPRPSKRDATPSPRRIRSTTRKKTDQALERELSRSRKTTSNHVNALSRAVDNVTAPNTEETNRVQVAALKGFSGKDYKLGVMRVHFKGERDSNGMTSGMPLGGAKIYRSAWSREQNVISGFLSSHLQKQEGFISAPNSTGKHGSEIAHIRPQHAGGMTDALGAQPASWHSNVEDMAREEMQAKLKKQYGDNVRIKSTAYLHADGLFGGTVKASRHKIYFRESDGKDWQKKFDHIQDGHRSNINKNEVTALKETMSTLSPASQTITSRKGIASNSDIDKQRSFNPLFTRNDSAQSPYFTDLKVGGKRHAGAEGHDVLTQANRAFSLNINPAYRDSTLKRQKFSHKGSLEAEVHENKLVPKNFKKIKSDKKE